MRVKEGVEGPKTKGLMKGLKLSLKLSQGLLFQHSDSEEEIAGKEPERVPVEPETPDVMVYLVLLSVAMATTLLIISLTFFVPTVSMFVPTMRAFPVSDKIPLSIVARRHPSRFLIW